jgi:hypothetical protein
MACVMFRSHCMAYRLFWGVKPSLVSPRTAEVNCVFGAGDACGNPECGAESVTIPALRVVVKAKAEGWSEQKRKVRGASKSGRLVRGSG